jgi:AbiV family abortive infection protein
MGIAGFAEELERQRDMASKRFHRLDGYAGPLTPSQAAEGIQAATRNARSLLEDARLLAENERWSRAASLAILAIEEAGKVSLLRSLVLVDDPDGLREEWRAYRSHTRKNVMGAFLEHVRDSPNIEDFRSLFDKSTDRPQVLDAVKQLGFYSDCLGDAHWSLPDEVVDEDLAGSLLATASVLAGKDDSPMTTPDELEIWVKYLKPVWRGEMIAMKRALIDCYQEAADKGVLKGRGSVEEMVRFIF